MPRGTKLIDDIDTTNLLTTLFEAYEEIAVMKMQKIRRSVMYTRNYMQKVGVVFRDTKFVYDQRLKGARKAPVDTKKKKTISILISPKDKFSGQIGSDVFESFYEAITTNKDDDVAIIGKIGKQMMAMRNKKAKFRYIEIRELGTEKFDSFVKELTKYNEIKVFYGKFVNIVKQSVEVSDLAQGAVNANNNEHTIPIDTIFEPSIQHVLYFFESQLSKSLFKQCVAESELARLGSQINGMEQANQNSKDVLSKLRAEFLNDLKSIDNKKQIERLAGFSLWRTI